MLKIALLCCLMIFSLSHSSQASQFVTILDATINVDRIEYIEPIFCAEHAWGTCGFTIVFSGGDYSVSAKPNGGYGSTHKATNKIEVAVLYKLTGGQLPPELDPANLYQSKVDALKALHIFRDQLPK